MNSLSIIQKTMDFELYVYPLLEKFPRAEKYAMITRVKNTLREIVNHPTLIEGGASWEVS
ncbi:MAG: hypothetical protein ACRCZ9_01895 [Fusobacteriaceae bacterium]